MVRLETSIPGRGLDLLGSYGPPSALESASAAHPGQRGDRRRCRRDVSPRGCASLARGAVPAEPSGADRARTRPTSSTAPGRRVRSRRPGAPGADEHRVVNRLVAAWGTTDDQEYDGRADVSVLSRAFRVRPGAARGVVDAIGGGRRPSFGNGPRRRALTRGRRRSLKRKQAGVPDQVLEAMAFVFSRGALTLRLRGNCAGNACLPCRVSRMAIIDARAVM